MALFRKTETPHISPNGRERSHSLSRGNTADGPISIIGPGMIVVGDIVTEGTVRIEGEVRGTVRAGKAVILGASGRIQGDVMTEEGVIGGRVDGSIIAGSRLELQSTSIVTGEIRAERLKLDEGARFAGLVAMISEQESGIASGTSEDEDYQWNEQAATNREAHVSLASS